MTNQDKRENLPPVTNIPPGDTFKGKVRFLIRTCLDMQMSSVYRDLRPWLRERKGLLLEVGCGAQPYRHLVPAECSYTGLDWEGADMYFGYRLPNTIYYDGNRFPFEDGSFDSLFHTEVLEHVFHASEFLTECRRVLKPSGSMLFTVPFQARFHYKSHDYFRFTPAALVRMLDAAGFKQIEIRPRGSDITVAAYKFMSVLYRWLRSGVFGMLLVVLFVPIAVPILFIGWLTLRLPVGSTDDCLGFTISAST